MRRGFAVDAPGVQDGLTFDQWFDVHLQLPLQLAQYVLSGRLDERIPILAAVIRNIYHRKPIFATLWSVCWFVLFCDVDVNSWIVIYAATVQLCELLLVVLTKKDVV